VVFHQETVTSKGNSVRSLGKIIAMLAGGSCVDGYFVDLQSDWCTNRKP
jgi:hypothetical protein